MPTLFDRLGREGGITRAVDDLYNRLVADPRLQHYIANVDMRRLRAHQAKFLVAATGGPKTYDGADMAAAHQHLHITGDAFDQVVGHLVETLADAGLDADVIAEVLATLAPLRGAIVSPPESLDLAGAPALG